jgi:ribonuclease E
VPAAVAAPLVRAQPAPLPLAELLPMLESAGMKFALTDEDKHAQIQARIAAEPKPAHVPRLRPELPPLDVGPLIQVETRRQPATPAP